MNRGAYRVDSIRGMVPSKIMMGERPMGDAGPYDNSRSLDLD